MSQALDFSSVPVVVQLVGVRGGEGASTLARAWARHLDDELEHPACVIDLPPQGAGEIWAPHGGPVAVVEKQVKDAVNGGLRGIVTRLSNRYNVVIVNGGPALGYSNAAAMARQVDGVILVLASEATSLADGRRARTAIEGAGGRFFGAVVNKRRQGLPRFLRWLFGTAGT